MKTCGKCGKRKKLSSFHRNKNRPQGVTAHCKDCRSEYFRERYPLIRTKMIKRVRRWQAEN